MSIVFLSIFGYIQTAYLLNEIKDVRACGGMVDAIGLGPIVERLGCSNPPRRTKAKAGSDSAFANQRRPGAFSRLAVASGDILTRCVPSRN